jgi:hypothetical protein
MRLAGHEENGRRGQNNIKIDLKWGGRVWLFRNRVLRRMFGTKRDEK